MSDTKIHAATLSRNLFPLADQRAEAITKLLVENVVCHHGMPEELLSDREEPISYPYTGSV